MKLRSFAAMALAASSMLAMTDASLAIGPPSPESVTIRMLPQNQSGEAGSAILTSDRNRTTTRVVIDLHGGVAQSAYIHEGTCANPGVEPEHGLADVVDGGSTTVVPAPLHDLLQQGTVISVNTGRGEGTTRVACGNISAADFSDS